MPRTPTGILRATAILCLGAVIIALVSQHVFDMRPCAWCVLQRFILLAIAAVCALASAVPGALALVLAAAAALLAAGGIIAAWYQYSVAANSFSCAQTFADKFMTASGLDAALPWLFGIYASCMDAKVSLLGVEYALWGLLCFVLALLASAWALLGFRSHRQQRRP